MAPRERHNSDPMSTLVRRTASDILAGVFDTDNQGAPLSPPSAGGSAGNGDSKESDERKHKMRQQLGQLDSQTKASGQPKEQAAVRELQENVDTYLRSSGELSDTESVTDPLEFTCNTPDGQSMKAKVPRTARVAELKKVVQTRTGVAATNLLLGALPLTDDTRSVYELWTQERLGRRVGQCSHLQMAPRCSSG